MIQVIKSNIKTSDTYYHCRWLLSTFQTYGTEVINPHTQKLRLVLGVGRSGTTWLAKTLSRTKTPVRLIAEPLFHFSPSIKFSDNNDHTAISYSSPITMLNRLEIVYRLLSSKKIEYSKYFTNKFLIRDDKGCEYVLIKEVHSLLQTEFLTDRLKCPTILICRNPLYIVDSLFDAQSLNTIYLKNEFNYLLDQSLYEHYFQKEQIELMECAIKINSLKESREKILLEKVFSTWVINRIFREIEKTRDYVKVVDYEQICIDPNKYFSTISNFLGFEYEIDNFNFSTTKPGVSSPYSVTRNTERQIERDYKFFGSSDISLIQNFFAGYSIEL